MKIKVHRSIGFKMAVAMAVGLFAVISLFSHTNVSISEKRLLALAEKEASKMSDTIKNSLDEAMLNNEMDSIQAIIDTMGREAMVDDIMIISLDAEVMYAKKQAEQGMILDKNQKSCAFCHGGEVVQAKNLTVMFEKENGERILRNVNPIHNQDRCHTCHDPQVEVLGKLLVDFSTADISQIVIDNRKFLILSAVATLLVSVFMCYLIATVLIKKPLHRLLLKMKFAGEDGAETEQVMEGEDEVTILDETYDSLMAAIQARNRQIEAQILEHQALFDVCGILNKSDCIDEHIDLIFQALNIGFKVRECSIMLFDEIGTLQAKGNIGLAATKNEAMMTCLSQPLTLERIKEGENFVVADGEAGLGDILVVPLKTASKVMGVIAVHRVEDKEVGDQALSQSFAIIATTMAPHFQIGLSQEEKRTMKVSPFSSYLEAVDTEITKVKEYFGALSLLMITVTDYAARCQAEGVESASEYVQNKAVTLSSVLEVVHECTRISHDSISLLLPMIDKGEAEDMARGVIAGQFPEGVAKVRLASYPEDGQTALELLHALSMQ